MLKWLTMKIRRNNDLLSLFRWHRNSFIYTKLKFYIHNVLVNVCVAVGDK